MGWTILFLCWVGEGKNIWAALVAISLATPLHVPINPGAQGEPRAPYGAGRRRRPTVFNGLLKHTAMCYTQRRLCFTRWSARRGKKVTHINLFSVINTNRNMKFNTLNMWNSWIYYFKCYLSPTDETAALIRSNDDPELLHLQAISCDIIPGCENGTVPNFTNINVSCMQSIWAPLVAGLRKLKFLTS